MLQLYTFPIRSDPCPSKDPSKSVFELTADDLLGLCKLKPEEEDEQISSRRLSLTVPTRVIIVIVRDWFRDSFRDSFRVRDWFRFDRMRSFRERSAAVIVRSRIAFCIIVFVGVVTALQLIPPIIALFK